MNETYVIGILTANRPEFLYNLMKSLDFTVNIKDSLVERLIMVNDGDNKNLEFPRNYLTSIQDPTKKGKFILCDHKENLGIAKSKNEILSIFMQHCKSDYLFLIEDDVVIKNPKIFNEYINISNLTGFQHLIWGSGGPNNIKTMDKIILPDPRYTITYKEKDTEIEHDVLFFKHCVGMFCLYTRKYLEKVGAFDEEYKNAVEHIDHSFKGATVDMIPGYGVWPDSEESFYCLDDQDRDLSHSSTRNFTEYEKNVMNGFRRFNSLYGFSPTTFPEITLTELQERCKLIKELSVK